MSPRRPPKPRSTSRQPSAAGPQSAPARGSGSQAASGHLKRTAPSHVKRTPQGLESQMVDVGAKPTTERTATARAAVSFPKGVLEVALAGLGPKGPVTEVARVAGILAAKRTGDLIPMCHPIALDHVEIAFERTAADRLEIRCRASCAGRTGVEMEALVGASVAALTLYDMTKALDHGIVIESVELLEKTGGKSGVWRKPAGGPR
jgi:cyclic pyranopterin monophosphate synthase